ncbi:hypothetical protein ACFV9D_24445 [Streptomyces sp. NPDC059875]|uniref:hypothetical protein n=1 Tax=unclassified Streptomyces TaxID=2593676 RepID=UPI00364FB387
MATLLDPESYTFTSVTLAPSGQAGNEEQVVLLPSNGAPVLLAVRARTESGEPATVVFTATTTGATPPPPLSVDGVLLVWGADAVKAVLPGGLGTLSVGHSGDESVRVDMLACLAVP